MTSTVLLLPWIQIEEPISIGDVVIYPFANALDLAGERRQKLEEFGSIYVDGYTLPLAIERREPTPRLKPTVAFVQDDDDLARHVRDAVDILMISTIFENHIIRANGATFASTVRSLDAQIMVDTVPRMHGRTLNAIGPGAYLEMRPPRVGQFHHSRKPEMVDALVRALASKEAPIYREILDALRTATSESSDVSFELAQSLMAKASTLLVHRSGMSDQKRDLLPALRTLLGDFMSESIGDEYGFHTARVWQAVRDQRNDFWHPDRRQNPTFPFTQQTLVAPGIMALRMVQALLVARLIADGFAPADSDLRADIVGIGRWFASLTPSLEDGLDGVERGTKRFMAHRDRAEAADKSFWEIRAKARLENAIARHMAEYREEPASI